MRWEGHQELGVWLLERIQGITGGWLVLQLSLLWISDSGVEKHLGEHPELVDLPSHGQAGAGWKLSWK